MIRPLFRPITTEDWRIQLAAARKRREGASARLAAALPVCSICGKPGVAHSDATGTVYKHLRGAPCFVPANPPPIP